MHFRYVSRYISRYIPMARHASLMSTNPVSCKDPRVKLWVLGIAKIFVRPGSEGTIYSRDFECISNMFPVTFPVIFQFRLHNPDILVGSRSVPRSDRSKISYFPRFVGRVRSQGFRGRSRFGWCLETELGIRFPIPTGFGRQVGRFGSKVKPGLDPTGIHH
jgi:hypothetical protein